MRMADVVVFFFVNSLYTKCRHGDVDKTKLWFSLSAFHSFHDYFVHLFVSCTIINVRINLFRCIRIMIVKNIVHSKNYVIIFRIVEVTKLNWCFCTCTMITQKKTSYRNKNRILPCPKTHMTWNKTIVAPKIVFTSKVFWFVLLIFNFCLVHLGKKQVETLCRKWRLHKLKSRINICAHFSPKNHFGAFYSI